MTATGSTFTAAPSAVGYLYQARLALALCLRYVYAEGGIEVAIEKLDDVSFEQDGLALELLQSKHHLQRTAELTDTSPDLWKTLRVWSELALADPGLPTRTRLTLVTTGTVPPGSIAEILRPSVPGEVISGKMAPEAATRLAAVAESSRNQALKPAFKAFLALTPSMRASLLSAVQILDGQPFAGDLSTTIETALRMVAPRGQAAKAREMLEGWWWPRVVEALQKTPAGSVSVWPAAGSVDTEIGLSKELEDGDAAQEILS